MASKELVFKLKFVDENGAIVEKTAQNIKEINKSIKDLRDEIENTDLNSEQWNDLSSELAKAEGALDKVGAAQKKAKDANMSFSDSLSAMPGPLGGVIQGAKAMNAALMKLVLNPIGAVIAAVVLALTALYKAFASTKGGAEKLDQIFAGISAAMDVLRDRVLQVGSALVKFFSGDFSGALEDVKGAVSGIGSEIAAEFQEAMKLKAELQSIADATRELNKERATQNKEIAKAKLVINDETKSYGERQAALEKVRVAEIALAKQEEVLAQRRYEAIKAQNALSDSSKEALDEEANAYIALQAAQQASLQKQKELFDQTKALRDKQRTEQKAAFDKRKQELQQLADLEQQLNLDLIDNADKRAIKELDIAKQKYIQQIKELKAGKKREEELIILVERNIEKKRLEIEKKSYESSLAVIKDFREKVLGEEDKTSGKLVEILEKRAEVEIENIEKLAGTQYAEFETREQRMKLLADKEKVFLDATLEQYDTYYQKQRTEADKTFNADMKLGENRLIEKQKTIDEFNKLYQLDVQRELDAEMKRTGETEVSLEKRNEIIETSLNIRRERQIEIDDYYDNYDQNRVIKHEQNISQINEEEQQRRTDILKKFSDTRNKIREQEKLAEEEKVKLALAGLDTMASIAGEESAIGKALAVASTTISTYKAAQLAYASQMTIPSPDAPIRAAVAAGIAIAQGLARVAQIVKVDTSVNAADGMVVGNGSGRLDNIPVNVSNGETIINSRSSKMFGSLLSSINQAGGGRRFASGGIASMTTQTSGEQNLLNQLVGQGGQPIKTYVVSTEVSTMQSLDRQTKYRSMI
tara:strand:+ start:9511 stop:11952 length:2442 start_codon:yes stop_codon:yes gene_type:complete